MAAHVATRQNVNFLLDNSLGPWYTLGKGDKMKLNESQRAEVKAELVKMCDTKPVRFLLNGRALNITTGDLSSKGSNVIYRPVYWTFSKATVKKICDWLGVKAVWSK